MISLDQIVSSNLEMLKEQEASLQQSLDFVQRAIQLFESEKGTSTHGRSGKKRGRKPGSVSVKASKVAKGAPKLRNRKGGKHIDRILALLREKKGPMSSGELIDTLFKGQSKDKNKKHFGTLIYPVLTKAYKSKTLRLKDGKIHLAS